MFVDRSGPEKRMASAARAWRRGAAALVATGAALHPGNVRAKYDVHFLPRVELRAESVGNARGADGGPNDGSDIRSELGLTLALQGQKPGSNWHFSYRPARQNLSSRDCEQGRTAGRLAGLGNVREAPCGTQVVPLPRSSA